MNILNWKSPRRGRYLSAFDMTCNHKQMSLYFRHDRFQPTATATDHCDCDCQLRLRLKTATATANCDCD